MDAILGLLFLVLLLSLYFLPAIIAWGKSKKNTGAIFVLNLFLGWTFIGWVIALIWASTYETGNRKEKYEEEYDNDEEDDNNKYEEE